MHYDTLLFDLDGTLLDFRQTEALSLAELFAAHGIPFTASLHRDYMEINDALWAQYERREITMEQVLSTRFAKIMLQLGQQVNGARLGARLPRPHGPQCPRHGRRAAGLRPALPNPPPLCGDKRRPAHAD